MDHVIAAMQQSPSSRQGNRLPDLHDCINLSQRWEPRIKIWKGSVMRQTGARGATYVTHGT